MCAVGNGIKDGFVERIQDQRGIPTVRPEDDCIVFGAY